MHEHSGLLKIAATIDFHEEAARDAAYLGRDEIAEAHDKVIDRLSATYDRLAATLVAA